MATEKTKKRELISHLRFWIYEWRRIFQSKTEKSALVVAVLTSIVGVCIWGLSGCEGEKEQPKTATQPVHAREAATPAGSATTRHVDSADYKSGPDDAKVKVAGFYPGRREAQKTIATVKRIAKKFPGKVQVEIIDWRFDEGFKRHQKTGLTCGGILINGKYIHKVKIGGKEREVLFVRAVNGEWTEEELIAAVRQELAKADEQEAAQEKARGEKDKVGTSRR